MNEMKGMNGSSGINGLNRNKRTMKLIIAVAAALFVVISGYIIYGGKPGELPSPQEALEAMNRSYERADAAEILDMQLLDKRHAFVPFTTGSDQTGMSFWVWHRFKWELRGMAASGSGSVHVWQLRGNDPSSSFFVWNMDPEEYIGDSQFYLLRDRSMSSYGDGTAYYLPRIQLKIDVNFREKPYGAMPYPQNWRDLIKNDRGLTLPNNSPFNWLDSTQSRGFYTGWLGTLNEPYVEENMNKLNNRSSWSSGGPNLNFVRRLDPEDLETPS
ncbi:hypothetical protein [Paenibacillus sp. HB172176]|uniref:hypothetical protein n=1 Tax=Paenibacillus sp. HB172176 TaxID=2493690 RepID=UPI00143AEA5B|nr:hypothetical protein [Paenibacillus sp. HB172176]